MKIATKAAWIGALMGLIVPLMCLAVIDFHWADASDWLLWIWPSSLGLMALEDRPSALALVLIYSETLGVNVLLYAVVAWGSARVVFSRPWTNERHKVRRIAIVTLAVVLIVLVAFFVTLTAQLLALFVGVYILIFGIHGGDQADAAESLELRRATKGAVTGALLGLLVPLISLAVIYLFNMPDSRAWLIWIWPSSPPTSLRSAVLENRLSVFWEVIICSESIGVNVLLYTLVAWGGVLIYSRIFRRIA